MRRSLRRWNGGNRPSGESEREAVLQTQCVRCGNIFYSAPEGGNPCPWCGLIPASMPEASAPSKSWDAPPEPVRDQPAVLSDFVAAAPPAWEADPLPDSDWQSSSEPYPTDSIPENGPYAALRYDDPVSFSDKAAPPTSAYRVGGQMDQWGAPLGPHDAAGISPPMVYHHHADEPPAPELVDRTLRVLAIIGVVMVVVIALSMVGIVYFGGPLYKVVKLPPTPTATIGPSPTPTAPPLPSGDTLYIDKNGLYSMAIPSEWTNITDQLIANASIPNGNGFVEYLDPAQAGVLAIAYTSGSASEFDDVETKFFSGTAASVNGGAVSNLSGPSTVTLAGVAWTQRTGDIALQNYGETLHLVVIATSYHWHVFLIAYGSLQESFASMNSNYFEPALATFTFRD